MKTKSSTILGQGSPRAVHSIAVLVIIAILTTWTLVSATGVVAPRFLPTPWRVWEAAIDLRPNIFVHAFFTTGLVSLGMLLGTVTGLFVGLWMRRSFVARSLLNPIVESWRPVPPVAIVPFFIMWFGFAFYGKLVLVALACSLVMIIGVVEAVDRLDPTYVRAALSFGATPASLVDEVLLPGILPNLLAPARIALATGIGVAVVAEFMGATRGIGHVISVALNTFATHTVFLCAITLGCIGAILDILLRLVHHRSTRWSRAAADAIQLGPNLSKENDR